MRNLQDIAKVLLVIIKNQLDVIYKIFYKKLPSSSRPEPTARIAVCGRFIMAENSLIPNIPKFEILHNKIAYICYIHIYIYICARVRILLSY